MHLSDRPREQLARAPSPSLGVELLERGAQSMISDLVVACRGLRRSPAFTVAAIVTLALGIGANTTMFSVVNAVLLRPLPGYQTDRLIQICDTSVNARFGAPGSYTFVAPQVYHRLPE